MISLQRNNGSFRDPRGYVYHGEGKIFRVVMPSAGADFNYVRSTGLIDKLIADGLLLAEKPMNKVDFPSEFMTASAILEHPRLSFISYPYEWSFSALKAAALAQLAIHLQALEHNVTLLDASPYNWQFKNSKPIFIDHLAFTRYQEGMLWSGHRQFCEQFLNPLLLYAYLQVNPNAWVRGNLRGITASDLKHLLPWYRICQPKVFMHVFLQSSLQNTSSSETAKLLPKIKLSKTAIMNLLQSMQTWITKLNFPKEIQSTWQNYQPDPQQKIAKILAVNEFVDTAKPKLLYDLGCNVGDYSIIALQKGAQEVIGVDSDEVAIEYAYQRAQMHGFAFTPLVMDLANPSPTQGWNQCERSGFAERGPADGVLALALIHHLVIGQNIPLSQFVTWLLSLGEQGLIEFVPKQDPMTQELLKLRPDIFPDYTEDHFLNCLQEQASIVKTFPISDTGRTLIWYKRK